MKTGLTKKQKVTELYFNENDDLTEIYTHNTELKKRLLSYTAKYPDLCKQTDDNGQGGLRFEIAKERISIRLTAPYSQERRDAVSKLAKKPTHSKMHNDEAIMKKIVSCEFNMDTGSVEAKFTDGSIISINCTAVENQIAENLYQRSELDWLIYNEPHTYFNLILSGEIESYPKGYSEHRLVD